MSVRKGGMIIAGSVADAQRVSNMEQVVSSATDKYPSSKAVNDLVPVGSMIIWGGPNAPAGRWIIANGAAISRTTYAELFAIYGTTWGAGDGNTTFNLPNAVNRYALGGTVGTYISESLPNITGNVGCVGYDRNAPTFKPPSGAFFEESVVSTAVGYENKAVWNTVVSSLNASLCSVAYQNGAKVRPDSFGVMWYVKY